MSERFDVRRMLLARGWVEDTGELRHSLGLWCGRTLWVSLGRDCSVQRFDDPRKPQINFGFEVPARVVVAACVALAVDRMADVAGQLGTDRGGGEG